MCAIDGADLWDMSTDQLFEYKSLEGPQTVPVPNGGYSNIIRSFVSELPPQTLWTNQVVKKIEYGIRGLEAGCRVTVGDAGDIIKADHVILTASLGVLKSGVISFDPPLPKDKDDAIQRMGLGKIEKIFFEFDESDWEAMAKLGFSNGMTITLTDPKKSSSSWTSRILGMNRTPGTRYMAIWVTSASSCAHVSSASEDALKRDLHVFMSSLCSKGSEVPRALSMVRTGWTTNPYTLGSWSYLAADSGKEDIQTLARPEQNLFFAGEATHRNYYGASRIFQASSSCLPLFMVFSAASLLSLSSRHPPVLIGNLINLFLFASFFLYTAISPICSCLLHSFCTRRNCPRCLYDRYI